jgi:alkanesulfonate monooxygenase SsuD/methylene tetrahydromethanopterin reductase-like flavin-dependent oxidoreductase (luciferase family)
VFVNGRTKQNVRRIVADLRTRAAPRPMLVFVGASVVTGRTEREARDLLTEYRRHASVEGALAHAAASLGIDFDGIVRKAAGSEGFGAGWGHGSDLLSSTSFSAGCHPARGLAVSMDGPRLARARSNGQTINRLQLSIRPLMQRAVLASMRSADRRPIILAGICGPIQPAGLSDPGPTGCHHHLVRPRTAETEAWRQFMPRRGSSIR